MAAHVHFQVLLDSVAFVTYFTIEYVGGVKAGNLTAALVLHTARGDLVTFFTPPQLAFKACQVCLGGHALALVACKVLFQGKRLEAKVTNAGNLPCVGLLMEDQLGRTGKVFGANVAAQLDFEEGLVIDGIPGGGLVGQHVVVLQIDKSVINKILLYDILIMRYSKNIYLLNINKAEIIG